MSRETFNLKQAAEHVHLTEADLKHAAQRGELAASEHGGDWHFNHRDLDEWAQRQLLAANEKALRAQHSVMMDENRREHRENWCIADLFNPASVDLALAAKAKAGVIRDMTDLAVESGLVYDIDGLYAELVAREQAAPTAIGREIAILHPRYHDPYFFEETFIAYGRSLRPIFFGAPDGEVTRHFFMVCSTDHEIHLHILARLAVLAHGTDLLEKLDAAESVDDVLRAVREAEANFIR